ncbi:hypothetical protein [Mesorhizobium sp. M7D.F.Ca.US.005.01.1.1]|uniref:hypothetical protein n=1 Tax=Mesorhizobium sp. M7D.F.Ca.US.005.01.1.1 TaxID=2493678 RepID=UPI0019D0AEB7|nr:hypothetical protein [Mesorhizobium sp. M7D.F.Ca.US.005.01.1.1]
MKAIAGAIVFVGFGLTVTLARANWLERPSVECGQSSGLPAHCDAATEWTRQTFKAFACGACSCPGADYRSAGQARQLKALRARLFGS